MSSWEERLYPHLHQPTQLAWFTLEEWYLIGICYLLATFFDPFFYLSIPVLIMCVFPAIRKKERGRIRHLMVENGVVQLLGYPPSIATSFRE